MNPALFFPFRKNATLQKDVCPSVRAAQEREKAPAQLRMTGIVTQKYSICLQLKDSYLMRSDVTNGLLEVEIILKLNVVVHFLFGVFWGTA